MGGNLTLKALQRFNWWPGMKPFVLSIVKGCALCQRSKASNRKNDGVLEPLPVPGEIWQSISVDFIMPLPKTAAGYDAIMVVVDRLSK